jgi:hypothetical protein
MADVPISAVTRRKVFTGSAGTGPYACTFEILAQTDIAVYFNGELCTLTTDYTVVIASNGTFQVTLVVGSVIAATPDADDVVAIVGAKPIARTTDFSTGGDFFAATVNTELDNFAIFAQQLSERVDRAIKAPPSDDTALDMELPAAADRASKALGFSATGEPIAVDVGSAVTSAANVTFTQSGTLPSSQTTQGKLRRIKELDDRQDVDNTGTTSVLTPFKNAVADVGTGGRLIVRRGRYKFTIASSSDTILLPSDFMLDCEEGVIFEWSFMGAAPLFAIIDEENVLIQGPLFEWDGTLADVSGTSSDFLGWTQSLPNRNLAAHILSLGSHAVRVRYSGCRTKGDAPSAATDCFEEFASFHHKDDGTTRTYDNAVEHCKIDDVVVGSLISGQDNFRFRDITSRRFPGNHPVGGGSGLSGHLLYATDNSGTLRSRGLEVRDVVDHGTGVGTITNRLDTSIQVKTTEAARISGITSRRPTGIFSAAELVKSNVSDLLWTPATAETTGLQTSATNGIGVDDCVLKNLTFILPDTTDERAFDIISMRRSHVQAFISASFSSGSFAGSVLSACTDNKVSIDFLARSSTTIAPCNTLSSSHRNIIEITPVGENQAVRPVNGDGCEDNVFRIFDNVVGKWSNSTFWTTEADSPAIGYESIKKSKVYRIAGGAHTNPTTTFQLPREGVWIGVAQLIEGNGLHMRGGMYRIAWDAGSLQSVELLGTEWTVGASAPSAMSLAVSSAGVVTVTSTANSFSWDMQYDFQSMGNYRYADF